MEKPGSHTKFWETYRVYSLLLLFPALLMFALSLMIYSGDDPEYYDRQTKGFIASCTDVTRTSRGILENGGPTLSFLIEVDYEVDGVAYTCRETWGSPQRGRLRGHGFLQFRQAFGQHDDRRPRRRECARRDAVDHLGRRAACHAIPSGYGEGAQAEGETCKAGGLKRACAELISRSGAQLET